MASDLSTLSDEDLAVQAQAGSVTSFEELVLRHEKRVFHFLCLRTRQTQDAEDLTQRTFIAAYRAIGRYKPRYRFVTWLFTIARRQAISHFRARRPVEPLKAHPVDGRMPDRGIVAREEWGRLWSLARDVLPENQLAALWLCYAEDLTMKEIAAAMNKTVTHVKVLLHRARKGLAAALRNHPMESEPPPLPAYSVRTEP